VLKVGADECCTTPIDVHEVKSAIMRALDNGRLICDNRSAANNSAAAIHFLS